MPAYFADADQVAALAAEFSRREDKLHILVNNAGTSWGEPFDQFPQSGWDKVMHVNLGAVFFRSEENTSELESLMRISYAVCCWKKKRIHLATSKRSMARGETSTVN